MKNLSRVKQHVRSDILFEHLCDALGLARYHERLNACRATRVCEAISAWHMRTAGSLEDFARATEDAGNNALAAYVRTLDAPAAGPSTAPLSAHRFFQSMQAYMLVCNRMQAGERMERFLDGLGFDSDAIDLCRGREVGRGIKDAFMKWLNSGGSLAQFVGVLTDMREAVLLKKLEALGLNTGGASAQAQQPQPMTTRYNFAPTVIAQPTNALVAALEQQAAVTTIGDFVKLPNSSDSVQLWALFNDDNLAALVDFLQSLNVLTTKSVVDDLTAQNALWQSRHDIGASQEARNANPALHFFRQLCQSPTFAQQSFAEFARLKLAPLNNAALAEFATVYLSRTESKKAEANEKNLAVVSAHTEVSKWLVDNDICEAAAAPSVAQTLHDNGFSKIAHLADCEKGDFMQMGCFNMGQSMRAVKALRKFYSK